MSGEGRYATRAAIVQLSRYWQVKWSEALQEKGQHVGLRTVSEVARIDPRLAGIDRSPALRSETPRRPNEGTCKMAAG